MLQKRAKRIPIPIILSAPSPHISFVKIPQHSLLKIIQWENPTQIPVLIPQAYPFRMLH